MQKIINFVVFLFVFSFLLTPAISQASLPTQEGDSEYFLIRTKNEKVSGSPLEDLGIFDSKKIDSLDIYRVKLTPEKVNKLKKNPHIEFIEKDKKATISYIPNDPAFSFQNYIVDSTINKAWDVTYGTEETIVAIIDTGVNYYHEDLKNIYWQNNQGHIGYDFVNNDNDPLDDHYHGTVVTGIIAANANNGIGIAGIANIRIMAIKAMTSSGDGLVSDISQGIKYAVDNGARIINLSLGLPEESQILDEAVNYAYNKNCLIIGATGNKGSNIVDAPARYSYAIGVGAINESNTLAEYSNYGIGTDIVALGEKIYSTTWNKKNNWNLYQYNTGTSFATPQVTGTAALLLSKDPSLSSNQIRKRILGTARKIPAMNGQNYTYQYGYGKLDSYVSLTYDKYKPKIDASIYKIGNNKYQINGTIIDDKNPVDILENTTDSNIGLVRYRIDNENWQTLNTEAKNNYQMNFYTPALNNGEHFITIESTDTAGNTNNIVLNTSNSIIGTISSSPHDYKAQLESQSSYVSFSSGQQKEMSLSFRNMGNSAWTKDIVHLGTSNNTDRLSIFADESWLNPNRIEMEEDIVAPGEIAHFDFTMTAPNSKGTFYEYFNLVAEDITWFQDIGLYWQINIEPPSYHAQYLGQSSFVTMGSGDTKTFWVEYRNTGSQTWDNSNVHLGTSNPLDRNSIFYSSTPTSGWKSNNRIKMEKSTVAPGESVRFTFTIQAPQASGTYYEHFRPVVDGVAWMEDVGLYWQIIVQ